MTTIYKKVGKNIRKRRKELGMSQEELAHKAKMDPKSIVHIEAGKRNPTLKTIKKIAGTLSISVEELLQDT